MRNKPAHRGPHWGRYLAMTLCFFMACLLLEAAFTPAYAKTQGGKDILQFTSGGHVVGFSPDSMYLASGTHMLKVGFVGGRSVTPVSKETSPVDGKAQPLSKVTYSGIWDGVDLVYEGSKNSVVKSTYTVGAGKTPASIRLSYNRPLTIDGKGNLVIRYDTGSMTESRPVAWQVVKGEKKPVQVAYNLRSDKEVGFTVSDYDTSLPLVIDPVFSWSTFLGGSDIDYGFALSVDSSGNVYVTGRSSTTWGSPLRALVQGPDAFVAKLTTDGALVWNTFLGGRGSDWGNGLTVDSSGNVYVVGDSDATWGSPVTAFAADLDAFVAKLTTDGAIVWHTFLGGKGKDRGKGIGVDSSGNVYVTGYVTDTWGSPVRAYTYGFDSYAAKLTADGTLVWNTFLGGRADDYVYGIAVDPSGNSYMTGFTTATWGAPVRAYTNGYDAFAVKLTTDGALAWNTFLGGRGLDQAYGITVDSSGNSYVAGLSSSTWGSPTRAHESGYDAFAVKLTTDGVLAWNTFLGGSGDEYADAIIVDASGTVSVTGYGDATWGSPVTPYAASDDVFVAAVSAADGALYWNAFLGGSGSDVGNAITMDSTGNVYVAGASDATWGSPIRPYTTSSADAFVAKFGFSDTFTLSVSTGGSGTGSVESSPAGIDCGSTCSASFYQGTSITLTATAETGSLFTGFTGCDSTSGNTCTVALTSDRTVTAPFGVRNLCTYTITSATSKSFTYKGGSTNVGVKATGGTSCSSPGVASSDTWIEIGIGSFKNNKGTVKLTASANNTVTARSGTVIIGGNSASTFTIKQTGTPCSIAISPTSDTVAATGGTDSFTATVTTGCAWTASVASTAASWLSLASTTGTGSAAVTYTAAANTTGKARSGKITVYLTDTPTKKKIFTVKEGK